MSNAELMNRRKEAVAQGVASATPVFAVRAENAELWDADGKRYLDFAQGIAVSNTGHRHPKVVEAVKTQTDAFTHTAFQVSMYEPYISLAERLNKIAPMKDAKSVFFTTGAEAVENAVKIARAHTGRPGIIAFKGAFHGRTNLTASLTGKLIPYKMGLGAPAPAVFHAPFPIEHHGTSVDAAIAGLESIFKVDIEAHNVAAIIVEPVQGEGGFYIAPKEFLQRLRAICDEHGILLIADEVQTGFARTGKMFAIEHSDVAPDIMSVAKAMAGGLPLSGVIGKREIMDSLPPGGLGGTYGGNPLGCAASHAVLDVIDEENLVQRSTDLGAMMLERIQAMKTRNDTAPIGDIRGLGSMVAFEMVNERGSHEPNPAATAALTAKALEKGLILLSCGFYGNAIRILAPLTIPEEQLIEGLDIIEESLVEIAGA